MKPDVLRTLSKNTKPNWLGLVSLLVGLIAWYLLTRYGSLPNFILPSPISVWNRFVKAVMDGSLIYNTAVTLAEILLGLLAGVLFATIVGYFIAKSRSLEKILAVYRRQPGHTGDRNRASAGDLAGKRDPLQGRHLRLDCVLPGPGQYNRGDTSCTSIPI